MIGIQINTYNETAETILGFKKRTNKPWIKEDTWTKIDQRNAAKKDMEEAIILEDNDIIQEAKEIYNDLAKVVKQSLQQIKREWANDIASEAENAYKKGNMRGVYDSTKRLCNSQQKSMDAVKDKKGRLITTEREVMERWKEHFQEVLNRPEPEMFAHVTTNNSAQLDIDTGYITRDEIVKAIKNLKNNKAAGNDAITGEVLKADLDQSSTELEKLFKIIWDLEVIPTDWEEGLIVKLPKKGDLTKCGNWRGLTLMSIPAKYLVEQ